MTRRRALASLAALASGMVLDPERALWVPGRRTHFDLGASRHADALWHGTRGSFAAVRVWSMRWDWAPDWAVPDSLTPTQWQDAIGLRPVGNITLKGTWQ